MSLSFTGLERLEGGQRGIEGFFAGGLAPTPTPKSEDAPMPPSSADVSTKVTITSPKRHREPSPMIKPKVKVPSASSTAGHKKPRLETLHTGSKRGGLDSFLSGSGKRGEPSMSTSTQAASKAKSHEIVDLVNDDKDLQDAASNSNVQGGDEEGWTCPRCGFAPEPAEAEHDDIESRKKEERQEHEDFHFAQDLQAGDSPVRSRQLHGPTAGGAGGRVKKKKTKEEGIMAFFAPRPPKK